MRQLVSCSVGSRNLSYVWHGGVGGNQGPLAIGDYVRVRNPVAALRESTPLVLGVVQGIHEDEPPHYLCIIHSKIGSIT